MKPARTNTGEAVIVEDTREPVRGPLAYVGFIALSSIGIMLMLLGLVGSFFLGFFLFVLLVFAAFVGLPIMGVVNLVSRARSRRRVLWEEAQPLPASASFREVDTSVAENELADILARWDFSEVLAQIASNQVPAESSEAPAEVVPIKAPHDAVVAVINQQADVDGARSALIQAGFPTEGIQVFAPWPENANQVTAAEQVHGLLPHVRRSFRYALMEEEPMLDLYEDERRLGHSVIIIPVTGRLQAEEVADILGEHNAHSVKFFGRWQITDLAPWVPVAREPVAVFEAGSGPRPNIRDLHGIDLFQGLSDADLGRIAEFSQIIDVPQGSVLARQGEPGRSIYLIQRGDVELTTDSPQGEMTVRIAGPGESFPLAALIGTEPLITNAVGMTEDLRVVEVPCGPLAELCEAEPRIGLRIYRTIAEILGERYRATLTRLTGALDKTLQEMLRQPDLFANI